MPRAYDMSTRGRHAARTRDRIVDAAERALTERPIGEVTLQVVADGAGVTVQTVLRHMGSRDGCFAAVAERVAARVDAQRGRSEPGDLGAAIADLVAHYEAEGRLVLNLLAHEADDEPFARRAAEEGRAYHRAWVQRCFGPRMQGADRVDVDALVAATDLYVWKLLRLDLGRSVVDTEAAMTRLVRALLEAP